MNITKNLEIKQPIIDSLLSIPGMLRASDLELKPRRKAETDESVNTLLARTAVGTRRPGANDDLYQDTPKSRVERIQKLIQMPVASAVLSKALERTAIKECIANRHVSPGRSWAAIIHEAMRRVVADGRLSEREVDLVRLGVVLTGLQQLIKASNSGEDEDSVYRDSKAARELLMELDPEAGIWLQHTLGHGLSDEDLTDRARYLQALVRQASHLLALARFGK
ncbi:hypothetical protein GCM10027399_25380 [Curvibacter fontanus]|jgi:hypothetical protein